MIHFRSTGVKIYRAFHIFQNEPSSQTGKKPEAVKEAEIKGDGGERAGLPRTLRSAWAVSELRKVNYINTEEVFRSKSDGSARDCSPFCTDSDNSILKQKQPTKPDHVT